MTSVIVILNYNDSLHTIKLAEQIRSYSCFQKIILVDNCSTDHSFQELQKMSSDKIEVVKTTQNGGYAKGNNFGIQHAIRLFNPDYIFVANPDVFIKESTCLKIMNVLASDSSLGVMTAMVNQGYNIWNLPDFLGIIESLFLIWFTLDKKRIKKKLILSKNIYEQVGVVEGSFFCITQSAYRQIGGLDERTFLYGEEIMLSYRLNKIGLKVGVLPHETYDHFHSVSIKKEYKSSKAKAFHHFKNSFELYNKEYLHTSSFQNVVFRIAYFFAYLERRLYDFVNNMKGIFFN